MKGKEKQIQEIQKKRNTKTKQKTETILKFKCLESISHIVDLTVLFIFSGLKNKKKSRHQWMRNVPKLALQLKRMTRGKRKDDSRL